MSPSPQVTLSSDKISGLDCRVGFEVESRIKPAIRHDTSAPGHLRNVERWVR